MKEYIKSRSNIILALGLLVVIVVTMTATGNILADQLPSVSELTTARYTVSQPIFEYNGETYEPSVLSITFVDKEGKEFVADEDKIIVKSYENNTYCGVGSVEVAIKGYEGTVVLDGAFTIKPEKVSGMKVVNASRELVELQWNTIPYADGYLLFKSNDNGRSFKPIKKLVGADTVSFQDTDVQTNAILKYYVQAYKNFDGITSYGDASETVEYYTPLDVAVLQQAQSVAYNSIKLTWGAVNGAVGYQVFRSNTQNGEYTLISEIADGATVTYTDATCECGIPYYYYVKACQDLSGQIVYGESSNIMSAKTMPNRVGLTGTTTNGDTEVSLQWKKSSGAQGYEVYKSQGSANNFQLVKTIENADTLSYNETGLEKKTSYYYRVRPYVVVNGEKIFGSYSGTYEKEITIEYSAIVSSSVSSLTQYVGRPYRFGGTSPSNGWDCSGFVQYAFKKHFGVTLPRTAREQASVGQAVSKNDRSAWQPGDLLFYRGRSTGYISHVAIYLGNGQMIHALSTRYDTLIQGVDYYDSWDNENTLVSVRRCFK